MLNKAKRKFAYFHGFLYALFNMPVTLARLKYSPSLKEKFLRGYFENI